MKKALRNKYSGHLETALVNCRYHVDLAECVCDSPRAIGGCLKCDLKQVQTFLEGLPPNTTEGFFNEFCIKSERGFPLCCETGPPQGYLITVERYPKWYSLYLLSTIHDSTTIYKLEDHPLGVGASAHGEGECLEHGESSIGDHTWNPRFVQAVADYIECEVDSLAWELIVGRWEIESKYNYDYPPTKSERSRKE